MKSTPGRSLQVTGARANRCAHGWSHPKGPQESAREFTSGLTPLKLPADLWREVRHHAVDSGKELGEIVSEALRAYLDAARRGRKESAR